MFFFTALLGLSSGGSPARASVFFQSLHDIRLVKKDTRPPGTASENKFNVESLSLPALHRSAEIAHR
jgi:hypothetical protein